MRTRLVTGVLNVIRAARLRKLLGQSMTEYALLLAAIAVVAYGAYFSMGDELSEIVKGIAHDL